MVVGGKGKGKSGSETRQRTRLVPIRFTPEEFAQVEAAASRAGLTRSSYGRVQMLSASPPRSVRRPPVEKELLSRILGQLGKAGSNINQAVKALHAGREDIEELRAAAAEVRLAAHAVIQALGRRK